MSRSSLLSRASLRPRHVAGFLSVALLSAGAGLVATAASAAPGDCGLTYTVTNTWSGGLQAAVSVQNTGSAAITSWNAGFTLPGGQSVNNLWNGSHTQSGQQVTVRNVHYNGNLAPGESTSFGFTASSTGDNGPATNLTLNGVACGTTPEPTESSTPTPSVTETPTPTPTPTDTGGPVTPGEAHQANPFAGAVGYINADWAAQVRAQATATGGALGTAMAAVANNPTAVWMDRIAAINGTPGARGLRAHLDAALAQQSSSGRRVVITVVVYDLPNRDCAALASNGELTVAANGLARYKTEYVDPIAAILGDPKYRNLRIATIVEPDSLPNLVTNLSNPKCAEANSSGAYVQGIQYSLNKLHAIPNVYTYLDIAHSAWLGWPSNFGPAVNLITQTIRGTTAGVASVDGFISNTANYTPLVEPHLTNPDAVVGGGGNPMKSARFYEWNPFFDEADYAAAMYDAFVAAGMPAGIGMLVDTSRNGWGGAGRPTSASGTTVDAYVNSGRIDRRLHRGNWCNQSGGIGERPQASPRPHFDAYVWIKPPGESDGSSRMIENDEGKLFDRMCDPTFIGGQQANGGNLTGAMANAPLAGKWFPEHFEVLVRNAFPALAG